MEVCVAGTLIVFTYICRVSNKQNETMKKFLLTMIALVGLVVGANAQTKGTLGYLTEKRGFKIFTLNTPHKTVCQAYRVTSNDI